jgi:hypothetical protein
MLAFEFNSVVDNGAIKVPQRYIERLPAAVKVIVLADDTVHPARKKRFTALSLDTKGFTFDRNEANER